MTRHVAITPHELARSIFDALPNGDKKQFRINEIVETAGLFYPTVAGGVIELTRACDRGDPLYVAKAPMWAVLNEQYGWMIANDRR